MSGSWSVVPRDRPVHGRPWLVLRGPEWQAILRGGRVLELHARSIGRLGPDILAAEPDFSGMVRNLRGSGAGRAVGDALLDQRLVAGIGNKWKAEALWAARVSPWARIEDVEDADLLAALAEAERAMRASVEGARRPNTVYRRAGQPCPRCRTPIASRGQGDDNRIAYWCPTCQPGNAPRGGVLTRGT